MTMNHKLKPIVILLSLVLLFFSINVCAKEVVEEHDTEIVIVLDCSQSMKDIDEYYEILDLTKGIISVVPKNYEIGIVAYNNEICFSLPLGCRYDEAEQELANIKYGNYGNAGAGLAEAVELFKNGQAEKRILMISDGEILMKTEEQTEESSELFEKSVEKAKNNGISIDILALGQRIEEGKTIYSAAESTSGRLYELTDSRELSGFIEKYLIDDQKIKERNIGTLDGIGGELSVSLPDCLMDKAKIILLGNQENENITVNCKANSIKVFKGKNYTVVEICKPEAEEVKIQMSSEGTMEINAYLTAEYHFTMSAEHDYVPETGITSIGLSLQNREGRNLLEGHMNDSRLKVSLDEVKKEYRVIEGKIFLEENIEEDTVISLKVITDELYGNYYGISEIEEQIEIPIIEEPKPQIDWFFWSVIVLFVIALLLILIYSRNKNRRMPVKRRVIDESKTLPNESRPQKNDFYGKVQVYVIHSREGIDYPPESINLFARCNREVITLEWILDACNLPLNLKGADRIVIRPGADKSLIIKNSGRVTAMKGRELLEKGHTYHLYYHEKVTFIFDQEDTEIEVHYKDLKPNER